MTTCCAVFALFTAVFAISYQLFMFRNMADNKVDMPGDDLRSGDSNLNELTSLVSSSPVFSQSSISTNKLYCLFNQLFLDPGSAPADSGSFPAHV